MHVDPPAERLRQLVLHFSTARSELSKTGVTRQLLWKEYLSNHPDGYSYNRYCHHLHEYLNNEDLSMHQEYQPGDMTMVDFAGTKHYSTTFSATRPYKPKDKAPPLKTTIQD